MLNRYCRIAIGFCALFGYGVEANALQTISGKVLLVEGTYMPGRVTFSMDAGNSTCPAGTWLTWSKTEVENNKAIYGLLMTALASGKKVNVFVNDGDTSCKGQYIHLTSYN